MESLQVRTGEVSLQILDDQGDVRGIFKFNPEDVQSAKNVVALMEDFKVKQVEFGERTKTCTTPEEQVDLLVEIVNYFENMVDQCFGPGSSQLIFGNSKTLSMFEDFFNGITPYYQKASEKRVAKYGVKAGK